MVLKIKSTLILLLLFSLSFSQLKAQDTTVVSKEELLNKLQLNSKVKIVQKELDGSRADYRQSNALFLPQLNVSYTAMTTNNPLMAFGSKLNQEILTQQDFNPALLNDPDRTDNYATEFSIVQPLINVDGFYQRKAARTKMEAMKLKAQRTMDGMKLELNKTYMQLQLSYEAVDVLDKAVDAAQSSLKMVNDYYDAGLIQKPDLLAVQVRVNEVEQQKRATENNLATISDYLAYLVDDSTLNQVYVPADKLNSIVNLELMEKGTSANRADVQAMQKAAEAYKQMSQSSKLEMLPRINAFGKYQMFDDEFLQADANGYYLGVQLSWDIFSGFKTIGKSQRDKINYEKAQLEAEEYFNSSELEVKKQYRQLLLLQDKVRNNEISVEQHQEAYKIRKDRFQQGLEKTNDLLLSEALLFQKELELLQSIFEYQLTQQYITFLTQ